MRRQYPAQPCLAPVITPRWHPPLAAAPLAPLIRRARLERRHWATLAAMPHLVAAPDKWRGSATAGRGRRTPSWRAAAAAGWTADAAPVSDGGEGFAAVLGGRRHVAPGPRAARRAGRRRVVPARRRRHARRSRWPWRRAWPWSAGRSATTRSGPAPPAPGELIAAAVKAGARHVLVGMGGSATTDGGWGALEALEPHSRLAGVDLHVACDVTTRFVDAAVTFSPQKGASPAQVDAAHPPPRAAGPGLRGALRRRRPGPGGVGRGRRPGRRAGGPRGHAVAAASSWSPSASTWPSGSRAPTW